MKVTASKVETENVAPKNRIIQSEYFGKQDALESRTKIAKTTLQ